jgi:hypothetical protein
MWVWVGICICVYLCIGVYERERESVCVCVCVWFTLAWQCFGFLVCAIFACGAAWFSFVCSVLLPRGTLHWNTPTTQCVCFPQHLSRICACIRRRIQQMSGLKFTSRLHKDLLENPNTWVTRGSLPFDDTDLKNIEPRLKHMVGCDDSVLSCDVCFADLVVSLCGSGGCLSACGVFGWKSVGPFSSGCLACSGSKFGAHSHTLARSCAITHIHTHIHTSTYTPDFPPI